ncbi:MAG: redoxin domain-containing protein [Bacteroidota bacterium]
MKTKLVLLIAFICCFQFAMAQHHHRYRAGDQLPDLILTDAFGVTVNTDDLLGHKILITFNRYVSCPLCNFRTHELLEHYDSLKQLGLIFISFYESGKETLTEYATKEEIPFVMVPDPMQQFYKQFKIQKSWLKTIIGRFTHYQQKHAPGKKLFKGNYSRDGHLNRIGADFLIDENGIIQKAYYGKYVGDHLPVEEIVKWVDTNSL